VEQYERVLAAVAANPEQKLGEIEILSVEERTQVVVEWNRTEVEYPFERCVHELFEEQAAKTPEAVAVVFEDEELNYGELNRRANELAHYLRELGMGPETIVGICVERSLEMVVGLLGILKAGGAYLPLEPSYPVERLKFMLEDAGPVCVVTAGEAGKALPAGTDLLELDGAETLRALALQPASNPEAKQVGLLPQHPAYVIYTSGSTGQPKGVTNEHGALVNRLEWMQQAYGLAEADAVLQKTPYSFDVSVWEFFWPLLNGARLVMARPGGHKDPNYLAMLIGQQQITTMHFVPSMLQLFLEEADSKQCSSLLRVICSG
jgi:non-ribosomal peptide synthetase component F